MIICAAVLTLAFVMYIRLYTVMLQDYKCGNHSKALY